MKCLICSLFFMVYAGAASAAERPEDFAYGSLLEADGSEALYEITLPAAVYRGVARPDLGDVRVFNSAGEVVPHAWRPRKTGKRRDSGAGRAHAVSAESAGRHPSGRTFNQRAP